MTIMDDIDYGDAVSKLINLIGSAAVFDGDKLRLNEIIYMEALALAADIRRYLNSH